MVERDNRNVLAWGENGEECQQKLYNSRVLVVGSDVLPQMILAGLVGLSVGHIYFIDNERINRNNKDFLCSHNDEAIGQKKVRHIEDTLKKINENIQENIIGIHSKFAEAFVFNYKPEIIIDGSNDPFSKEKALCYALRYRLPFISASSDNGKAAIAAYFPKNSGRIKIFSEKPDLEALLMENFNGQKQEGFTSGIVAGLVCEEIRKIKFKYTNDGRDGTLPGNTRLVYNLYSDSRKEMGLVQTNKPSYFRGKKALVVGAGGIGNFVALSLALLGVGRMDILDMDTVEGHNLNRQILFYGGEGEKKAEVLAKRVGGIDKFIQTESVYGKIGEINLDRDVQWLAELYNIEKGVWGQKLPKNGGSKFPNFEDFVRHKYEVTAANLRKHPGLTLIKEQDIAKKDYDVIFGCLDNKFARLWLNNFAVNYSVPYIDGGTGPKSGQMAVYVPGKTKCVNCQVDLMRFPSPKYNNDGRDENSCAERPEGSVVMSNMIIGSAMVGEAIRAMYSIGDPLQSDFRYRAMEPIRIGLRQRKTPLVTTHNC